jgi:hypothetical protein
LFGQAVAKSAVLLIDLLSRGKHGFIGLDRSSLKHFLVHARVKGGPRQHLFKGIGGSEVATAAIPERM